jgi:hypothetical protein
MNMAGRSDKGSKNVDEHSVEVSNLIVFYVMCVKKARTCLAVVHDRKKFRYFIII